MGEQNATVHVPQRMKRWKEGKKIEWYFNRWMASTLLKGIDREMGEKNYYLAMYCMIVAIQVYGGFFTGRKGSRKTYLAFVEEYFNPLLKERVPNPLHGKPFAPREMRMRERAAFAELLWYIFRAAYPSTGLVYPAGSVTGCSRYYCRCYRRAGIKLDVGKFYRDFTNACARYANDVYNDYFTRRRFITQFDRFFGLG